MIFDSSFLKNLSKETTKQMQLKCFCQTCGLIFLEVTAETYLELTSHFVDGSPDKWFVESGIHWCTTERHNITFDNGVFKQDINAIWENKRRKEGLTKRIMHPHFLKYRKACKNKAI